jgi:hypothetical protein
VRCAGCGQQAHSMEVGEWVGGWVVVGGWEWEGLTSSPRPRRGYRCRGCKLTDSAPAPHNPHHSLHSYAKSEPHNTDEGQGDGVCVCVCVGGGFRALGSVAGPGLCRAGGVGARLGNVGGGGGGGHEGLPGAVDGVGRDQLLPEPVQVVRRGLRRSGAAADLGARHSAMTLPVRAKRL